MNLKLVTGLAVISVALLSVLNNKLSSDFENGELPIKTFTETEEDLSVSYTNYDYNNFLTKTYKILKEPKKINNDYKYTFKSDDYLKKEVYFIKNDSLAMSYSFEKNKNKYEKEVKKQVFKKRFKMFKREDVSKIYYNNNSNFMQTSYLIEFENPKSVMELYEYTSQFKLKNEKKMKVFRELSFISMYENKKNKYKRLNLVYSNKNNGYIWRNLVSEHLDANPVNQNFELIYKKGK
tara:strand:+ start:28296 stop:29003 length:708 start_codon:yes stop_codon:yes gene_type:complete